MPNTLTGMPSQQMLKIHKSDDSMGRIEAGLRAKTLGIQDIADFSRITIQLQRIDEQSTRIQIESHPTNPLESFDLARHMHYVNHLALSIRQASQAQVAENNLSADIQNHPKGFNDRHISDEIRSVNSESDQD